MTSTLHGVPLSFLSELFATVRYRSDRVRLLKAAFPGSSALTEEIFATAQALAQHLHSPATPFEDPCPGPTLTPTEKAAPRAFCGLLPDGGIVVLPSGGLATVTADQASDFVEVRFQSGNKGDILRTALTPQGLPKANKTYPHAVGATHTACGYPNTRYCEVDGRVHEWRSAACLDQPPIDQPGYWAPIAKSYKITEFTPL